MNKQHLLRRFVGLESTGLVSFADPQALITAIVAAIRLQQKKRVLVTGAKQNKIRATKKTCLLPLDASMIYRLLEHRLLEKVRERRLEKVREGWRRLEEVGERRLNKVREG